jgi:hypothetical protein
MSSPLTTDKNTSIYYLNRLRNTRVDSYLLNVQQNNFNKVYRAKTPRTQRKKYFSELGALCVFARGIFFRFRKVHTSENFKYIWLDFLAWCLSDQAGRICVPDSLYEPLIF